MKEQTQQIAQFLFNLIQNNCTIPGNQAENLVASKQMLSLIAQGKLEVTEAPGESVPPLQPTPPAPEGNEGEGA